MLDEYFDICSTYKEKYPKSVVIFQVGSFYEMYRFDSEDGKICGCSDIYTLSTLLNISIAKKSNCVNTKSETVTLLGFPKVAEVKYVTVLMDNNYTVIVVDQTTQKPNPKREVVAIYSPGTYVGIDNNKNANRYIVSLYMYLEPQFKLGSLLCIGVTYIDIYTGELSTTELFSSQIDTNCAEDECIRLLQMLNPIEILVNEEFNLASVQLLSQYLTTYHKIQSKPYEKISYQNEVLAKVYNCSGIIAPIEYLNIEQNIYSNISLIMLFVFLFNHNKKLLNNITHPNIVPKASNLILGNNSIEQLNIVGGDCNLFDIVNNTSTPMGYRMLRHRLTNPLLDCKQLDYEYNTIEKIIEAKDYNVIQPQLKQLCDIEKMERRVLMDCIHPYEFLRYYQSYKTMCDLRKVIDYNLPDGIVFGQILGKWEDIFNFDDMKYPLNEIGGHIFKRGIHPEIDKLHDKIDLGLSFLDKLSTKLEADTNTKIHIKSNKSEGYFLSVTKLNMMKIQTYLKSNSIIVIDDIQFDSSKLVFKSNLKSAKILIKDLIVDVDIVQTTQSELFDLNKVVFTSTVKNSLLSNLKLHNTITRAITHLDYFVSNSISAVKYNYNKPSITSTQSSSIQCVQLRHPIIERIISHEYIPHDIRLSKDNSILLFGLNSSGKSSIMKAIGLCVVMAQAGMFVPCKECTIDLYDSLYTRIAGTDNLSKGLSSFTVEMLELKNILTRSTGKTFVIGDEICRGTEYLSANSLVASAILILSKKEVNFIFSTHLNNIINISVIKQLSNVKKYHLTVENDVANNRLIYDRKLKEGPGELFYGITVAKYFINTPTFIDVALTVKNELLTHLNQPVTLFSTKTSRYNKDVFVSECKLCGSTKNLHTHHIHHQEDCDEKDHVIGKEHISKNDKCNLIVLCEDCHHKIHTNDIEDIKPKLTTTGIRYN